MGSVCDYMQNITKTSKEKKERKAKQGNPKTSPNQSIKSISYICHHPYVHEEFLDKDKFTEEASKGKPHDITSICTKKLKKKRDLKWHVLE